MTWSYRVMRKTRPNGTATFSVHEVYYHEGTPVHWTEPVAPIYHAAEEDRWSLRAEFERMMLALDKPVLDAETGEEVR